MRGNKLDLLQVHRLNGLGWAGCLCPILAKTCSTFAELSVSWWGFCYTCLHTLRAWRQAFRTERTSLTVSTQRRLTTDPGEMSTPLPEVERKGWSWGTRKRKGRFLAGWSLCDAGAAAGGEDAFAKLTPLASWPPSPGLPQDRDQLLNVSALAGGLTSSPNILSEPGLSLPHDLKRECKGGRLQSHFGPAPVHLQHLAAALLQRWMSVLSLRGLTEGTWTLTRVYTWHPALTSWPSPGLFHFFFLFILYFFFCLFFFLSSFLLTLSVCLSVCLLGLWGRCPKLELPEARLVRRENPGSPNTLEISASLTAQHADILEFQHSWTHHSLKISAIFEHRPDCKFQYC